MKFSKEPFFPQLNRLVQAPEDDAKNVQLEIDLQMAEKDVEDSSSDEIAPQLEDEEIDE